MENKRSDNEETVFSKILDENIRTTDVISDVKSFNDLMISPKLCELLNRRQFFTPTPVQARAIPLLLLGSDMLVQAKAGTGKTLVFAVLASKILHETDKSRLPQVLIVSPTREIAKQIYEVVRMFLPLNFWAGLFVGGTDINSDLQLLKKGCQIAIGTCGRIVQLLNTKILNLKEVQLFVLDEADKLMEADFVKSVNVIFSFMPQTMKQVCVFSATYPQRLEDTLKNYMQSPILLRLNTDGEQLIGVKEYCVFCDSIIKADALLILLKRLVFNQCIVFCDTLECCQDIYNFLIEHQIECTSLGSNLPQDQRFQILKKLKNNQVRILVATDLMARGVDITGVDLVVNLSPSYNMETHLHRVGRAGRYGGKGVAITMLENANEAEKLRKLMKFKNLDIRLLDICSDFPYDLSENIVFHTNSVLFEKHKFMSGDGEALIIDKAIADELTNIRLNGTDDANKLVTTATPTQADYPKLSYPRQDLYHIFASRTEKDWNSYAATSLKFLNYICVANVYEHPELLKLASDHQPKAQQLMTPVVDLITSENEPKIIVVKPSQSSASTKSVPPAISSDALVSNEVFAPEVATHQQFSKNKSSNLGKNAEALKTVRKPDDSTNQLGSVSIKHIPESAQSCKPTVEAVVFDFAKKSTLTESTELNEAKSTLGMLDDREREYLKPFKEFRSIQQFRAMYNQLSEELERNRVDDLQCFRVSPIVPPRSSVAVHKQDIELMKELRKRVIGKP